MIELIAILDRSGSMRGKQDDVIGGFNNFIADQKKLGDDARVTLVLFDHEYKMVHNKINIKDVPELTNSVYFTRGSTALLDAVGKTLSSADRENKGIVFIFTDGMENSSQEYKKDGVKKLVEERKQAGWEVHFIGADIDAYGEGMSLGMDKNAIFKTSATPRGLAETTAYMSTNSIRYRTSNR